MKKAAKKEENFSQLLFVPSPVYEFLEMFSRSYYHLESCTMLCVESRLDLDILCVRTLLDSGKSMFISELHSQPQHNKPEGSIEQASSAAQHVKLRNDLLGFMRG